MNATETGNKEKQTKKKQKVRPKHVPQRTCIACRSSDAKRQLLRIVRVAEGQVEVDPTGKKNGRGAYLCKVRECWEIGLNKKALDFALKTTIEPTVREELRAFGANLPGKAEGAE
jgi:uncharacterized protein